MEPYENPILENTIRDTVPKMSFDEYSEKYKDYFVMKRENHIIELRMHTNNGPASWTPGMNQSLGEMFRIVSGDPENEVVILTGSEDRWLAGLNKDFGNAMVELRVEDHQRYSQFTYDDAYGNDCRILMNLIYDCDLPIIAAINGWSTSHTEFAIASDITLITPDVELRDGHFMNNMAPGDGQMMVFQQLLGTKRAAYYAYTGKPIPADKAVEWGLADEIVERDKILDRAWELAEMMMSKDRYVRRVTHEIVRRPWRQTLSDDFNMHFAYEMWSMCMCAPDN